MDRISQLIQLIQSSGQDSFLQHALALEYIKVGNDQEAEIVFSKLLSNDPSYIGSYYHLGKLLERNHRPQEAIPVYENGIREARAQSDLHSINELRAALEQLQED